MAAAVLDLQDRPALRARDGSLNAVRAVIPERCYERRLWRALLGVAQAVVLYGAAIALLALTDHWLVTLVGWLLAGLGVSGLFILAHDASHGALTSHTRLNRWIARLLFVPSLHAEAAWALGHNRVHHGYTCRQGMDFVWQPLTVDEYRALGRFAKLRHRLEWSWAGAGAYYLREVWWNKMWRFTPKDKWRRPILTDKAIVVAGVGIGAAAAGVLGGFSGGIWSAAWMVTELVIVPFLVFTWTIGFTVYVHHVAPDIRWWPKREWSQYLGQMESTTVLRVPRVMNLWLHNIFVHIPHHVDMRIPFHQLPAAAKAIAGSFPVVEDKLTWRRYFRSVKACKLYDFTEGRWLPYSAAR
jgi:acyl-lipid omega-6 desaturase (Delta-12 desaturase)